MKDGVNLESLIYELPEDIVKAKWAGDFERAKRLIDIRISDKRVPEFVKERLRTEKYIINTLPMDYIYSIDEALEMIHSDIPDFTEKEFNEMLDASVIDWIYINGKVAVSRRFLDNLYHAYPEIAARSTGNIGKGNEARDLLLDTIEEIEKKGHVSYHFKMRLYLKIKDEAFRPGQILTVHLPVPIETENNFNINISSSSFEVKHVSDSNFPQRTICMIEKLYENKPFTIECDFSTTAKFRKISPDLVSEEQPSFFTEEVFPHIRFSPTIKKLCHDLTDGIKNPLIKARKIYDYCTENVVYSYMREYISIENIPEYAALQLKGDCGVQALLFITLCRCAGIPAKWQSGQYINPFSCGCHDWAMFYIAPFGWLYADPSFGGSGYRAGDVFRHNHYFGNLDPFRLVSAVDFQKDFDPEKIHERIDPYDNQRGEAEYMDHGLMWNEIEAGSDILEYKRIE